MSRFALAAAGTGGHVFPALAVAAELRRAGVSVDDIFFMGGSRIEARIIPGSGYEFVELPLRGLRRSMSARNLTIPFIVAKATRMARRELTRRGSRVLLATGGYVTVPSGWAAHRAGVPLFLQEQNAAPGLANRLAARWAQRVFLGFPSAAARLAGEITGNPLARAIADFDRDRLRPQARAHYGVPADATILGVVGGSLGAAVINRAVADLVQGWSGPPLAVVHIAGPDHADDFAADAARSPLPWRVLPFEEDMARFYAAVDLVICRGSGMTVSELAATGTPALLVPRKLASDRHQDANATELVAVGAAEIVTEDDIAQLSASVDRLVAAGVLATMAKAAAGVGRPEAAATIAAAMMEVAGGA